MMSLTVKEMRKELSYVINHVEHLSIKDVRYRYYKLIKKKIMKPKEKAKELVYKYMSFHGEYEHSKQCALICVDEILNINILYKNNKTCNPEYIEDNWTKKYWQEVKQGINKL